MFDLKMCRKFSSLILICEQCSSQYNEDTFLVPKSRKIDDEKGLRHYLLECEKCGHQTHVIFEKKHSH